LVKSSDIPSSAPGGGADGVDVAGRRASILGAAGLSGFFSGGFLPKSENANFATESVL
jgi:hypothetical protein